MRTAGLLVALIGLAAPGCGGSSTNPTGLDASIGTCSNILCRATCCAAGQSCFNGVCCTPTSCAGKQCGDDGCGASCGTCTLGGTCDTATGHCSACVPESSGDFCARLAKAGKVCGQVADTDNCTQAARTEDCGSAACTGTQYCQGNACVSPPANDTCAGAQPLAFSADTGSASAPGDTTLATADYEGSCSKGAAAGQDVVYSFTITGTTPRSVLARVAPYAGGTIVPALYIRSDCESSAAADELACAVGTDHTSAINANVPNAAPGTYYVIVDSVSAPGPFRLTVTLGTAVPPNDECPGTPLTFDAQGAVHVTGTTLGANDNYTNTCQDARDQGGNDVVYSFTIPSGPRQTVDLVVTADADSPDFQPSISIGTGCGLQQQNCSQRGSSGAAAEISLEIVNPGSYYVVVDGFSDTAGDFSLDLQTSNFPDDCNSTRQIALDANGHGQVSGDTTEAVNDASGSCMDSFYSTQNDLVYFIDTTGMGTRNLSATLVYEAGVYFGYATLYVRRVCSSANAADELACNVGTGDSAAITVDALAEGKYYLWVDSESFDGYYGGPFTLTVDATTP